MEHPLEVSICIPVYNAEATIEPLVLAIGQALPAGSFEIILVNDHSRDDSESVCEHLATTLPHVRFFSLRRNFGEHNTVMCALNQARGLYAVITDDDFQNPPEEIPRLVAKMREGYDVVYTRYARKAHHPLRNLGSRLHNRMASRLLNKPKELYLSSFKAIHRDVYQEIIRYRGPFPYVDGLIFQVTDHVGVVDACHHPRVAGRSNYTLGKLVSLWLNMFLNFSILPLRLFTILGALLSLSAFVFGGMVIVEKLTDPTLPTGWASLMVALQFFSGILMIFMGLMGEYLGKLYFTIAGAPQWIIKKRVDSQP